MHIASDSHYHIGKTHLTCQDYAYHGLEPLPFIIVADGCSSSPHSDIGARILTLTASQLIAGFPGADYWVMGQQIATLGAQHIQALGLAPSALDATLIVALQFGSRIQVYLYGDGCLVCQHSHSGIQIIHVEYEHSAPYYLSYLEDAPNRERYIQANPAKTVHIVGAAGVVSEVRCIDEPAIFEFCLDEIDILGIASDGLSSFSAATTGCAYDTYSVARELLSFKNFRGDFVKRRLRRTLATFGKKGVYNNDDIALGIFAKATA